MVHVGIGDVDSLSSGDTPTRDTRVRRDTEPSLVDAHHELTRVVVEEENVDNVTADCVSNVLKMLLLNSQHL
jgi:hypothetical protein